MHTSAYHHVLQANVHLPMPPSDGGERRAGRCRNPAPEAVSATVTDVKYLVAQVSHTGRVGTILVPTMS
jgi:hypothetical protein